MLPDVIKKNWESGFYTYVTLFIFFRKTGRSVFGILNSKYVNLYPKNPNQFYTI